MFTIDWTRVRDQHHGYRRGKMTGTILIGGGYVTTIRPDGSISEPDTGPRPTIDLDPGTAGTRARLAAAVSLILLECTPHLPSF